MEPINSSIASSSFNPDKQEAIDKVTLDGMNLKNVKRWRNDPDVAFAAIRKNSMAITHIGPSLKAELAFNHDLLEQITIAALSNGPMKYEDITAVFKATNNPELLRKSKLVMIAAKKVDYEHGLDVPPELRTDPDIIAAIAAANLPACSSAEGSASPVAASFAGGAGLSSPPQLPLEPKEDPSPSQFPPEKQAAIDNVKENGMYLQGLSKRWQSDVDVASAAVKQNGRAIAFVHPNMQMRCPEVFKSIMIIAVSHKDWTFDELEALLTHSGQGNWTKDIDVMSAAIRYNGKAASFVDPSIKEVPSITDALAAAAQEISPIRKKIQEINVLAPDGKPSTWAAEQPIGIQRQRHGDSKLFLTDIMTQLGGNVAFIFHNTLHPEDSFENATIHPDQLDSSVVSFERAFGVQQDVQKCGRSKEGPLVIFSAACQFNLAAPAASKLRLNSMKIDRYTPQPERAIEQYLYTVGKQGSEVQLAYPTDQIRAIAAAANFPYNGLCNVLDQKTIKTTCDGYFTPTPETSDDIIQQLKKNGHLMECALVGNTPRTIPSFYSQRQHQTFFPTDDDEKGPQKVYMILVAAPETSPLPIETREKIPREKRNGELKELLDLEEITPEEKVHLKTSLEIQYLTSLHRARTECAAAIYLAQQPENKDKPVELKVSMVGCGDHLKCQEKVVAQAQYQALIEYQKELKANNVTVQIQFFNDLALEKTPYFIQCLGLQEKKKVKQHMGAAAAAAHSDDGFDFEFESGDDDKV